MKVAAEESPPGVAGYQRGRVGSSSGIYDTQRIEVEDTSQGKREPARARADGLQPKEAFFGSPALGHPHRASARIATPRLREDDDRVRAVSVEKQLLARCIDGERSAWRALHSQYYPVALGFLRRMGVPPEELDDTCQEVFVRCFRSLESFRGDARFKTWFYRICFSEANRWRRWRRLSTAVRKLWASSGEYQAVAHQEFSPQIAAAHVQAALQRMSEGERAAFILYEFEGQTGREIAEILGCPAATVWRRLHDARRMFKRAIVSTDEGVSVKRP